VAKQIQIYTANFSELKTARQMRYHILFCLVRAAVPVLKEKKTQITVLGKIRMEDTALLLVTGTGMNQIRV
jgi:hypothetical protein